MCLGLPCTNHGDKIFEHDKAFVEDVFGASVYESYGSAEGFLVAAHCGVVDSLKVMEGHVLLEIVDFAGEPVPPGQLGQIVVTVLDNLTMPLVRYNTGDLGRLVPQADNDAVDHTYLAREICRRSELIGQDLEVPFTVHDLARVAHEAGPVQNFRLKRKGDGSLYFQCSPEEVGLGQGSRAIARILEDKLSEPVHAEVLEGMPRMPSGKPEFISI
jgi:phenylacetate-CoA ligase